MELAPSVPASLSVDSPDDSSDTIGARRARRIVRVRRSGPLRVTVFRRRNAAYTHSAPSPASNPSAATLSRG
ncbi:hypothetical protein GGF41_007790, partial [Coemansia sp. RSA 2531]